MVDYNGMYNSSDVTEYTSDYTPSEDVSASTINEIVEVPIEETTEETMHTGKVDNCEAAYIRESPTKASNHIAIVKKGEELIIEDTVHTNWYKATTQNGVEGYIMRNLVSLD